MIKVKCGYPNLCDSCGKEKNQPNVYLYDYASDTVKLRLCKDCFSAILKDCELIRNCINEHY